MTAPEATTSPEKAPSWRDSLAVYLQPRVLIVLLLGFSSGLPLALSGSTLRFWLRESHIDLEIIGLFALVGTPYTIKFLWAPLVDALNVPLLSKALGRRRGWLILSQLLLVAAILLLGFCNPAQTPWYVPFGAALLVATASATQDIVVDAFRFESLPKDEQAAGMASYVAAYRITMEGHSGDPLERVIATTKSALMDFQTLDAVAVVLVFVVLFKFTDAFSG